MSQSKTTNWITTNCIFATPTKFPKMPVQVPQNKKDRKETRPIPSGNMQQVPDPDQNQFDSLESNELKNAVNKAISFLSEREKQVVELYFGLGGLPKMNFDQIGDKLGIARERCRQIINHAFMKLKEDKSLAPWSDIGYAKPKYYQSPSIPSEVIHEKSIRQPGIGHRDFGKSN